MLIRLLCVSFLQFCSRSAILERLTLAGLAALRSHCVTCGEVFGPLVLRIERSNVWDGKVLAGATACGVT